MGDSFSLFLTKVYQNDTKSSATFMALTQGYLENNNSIFQFFQQLPSMEYLNFFSPATVLF
jgi:hypothetical protein